MREKNWLNFLDTRVYLSTITWYMCAQYELICEQVWMWPQTIANWHDNTHAWTEKMQSFVSSNMFTTVIVCSSTKSHKLNRKQLKLFKQLHIKLSLPIILTNQLAFQIAKTAATEMLEFAVGYDTHTPWKRTCSLIYYSCCFKVTWRSFYRRWHIDTLNDFLN